MSTASGNIRRFTYPLSDRMPFSGEYYPRVKIPKTLFDMHFPLEFGILLKGRARRYVNNWSVELTPGQVTFNGIWESHGIRTVSREPFSVFVLIIWPALLAQLHCPEAPDFNWLAPFIAPPGERPQAPANRRQYFMELGHRFVAALQEPPALRMIWLRVLLMESLLELNKTWRAPSMPKSAWQPFQQINQAVELAFQSQKFTTTQAAARDCGMNRMRFSRFFKTNMGVSFADFALRHRLSRAVARMLSNPEPLKAVAHAWGFADESHFHRVFHRHYHCAPAVYRKQHAEMQAETNKSKAQKGCA